VAPVSGDKAKCGQDNVEGGQDNVERGGVTKVRVSGTGTGIVSES
jgi:hypothetical protein